jgi:phosphoserine phosphatase RsbU/P
MFVVSSSRIPASPIVLVVDDDPTTSRALDGMLRGAGLETTLAHDVAGAERIVATGRVSLALLDVNLPDGSGLDLCARISHAPMSEGMPILMISASDDVQTKLRGFASGAVDYITKPLAGAEVLARVRTHLRLRAAQDAIADLQAERIGRLAATQQSLMPQPQDIPAAGFNVEMRQALLAGGDFYDVVPLGGRVTDYVVADASGHDLGVSLWTASFKTQLAQHASILNLPEEVVGHIDHNLRRVLLEGAYFTAVYARLNRAAGRLTLVNAGHPGAILVSGRDRSATLFEQQGDVIGVFSDAVFGLLEVDVEPGDRLYLYSDGLVETVGSRELGTERLVAACRLAGAMPPDEAIPWIVDELCDGRSPEDDIVLLGVVV